jgi:hypothetical protein
MGQINFILEFKAQTQGINTAVISKTVRQLANNKIPVSIPEIEIGHNV